MPNEDDNDFIPEMPDDFGAEYKNSKLHTPIEDMSDAELDAADAEVDA